MASLLAALFPAEVAAADTRRPADLELLHADEARHIAKAIAKRAGEFAAGRLCARQALAALGISDFPLLVGEDRRPLWPPGVVGSITHTRSFYGAVVARSERFRSIGVDAEMIGRVGPHLWPKVCSDGEIAWIESQPEAERARLGALVFSAKEAFYKCQYGLTEAWVGFHDVELDPAQSDPAAGRFAVRPLTALALQALLPPPWCGQCRFEADLVVSGMAFTA